MVTDEIFFSEDAVPFAKSSRTPPPPFGTPHFLAMVDIAIIVFVPE
jgi:hypothetical protein